MDVIFPEVRYKGMETSLQKRLKLRMDMMGMNAYQTAKKAGLGDSFVRDILRGKTKSPSSENLQKLASALDTEVDWFLISGDDKPSNPSGVGAPIDVTGLPVAGIIQAGTWLDLSLVDEDFEQEVIPVAADPRFPHARQYSLKVLGDSMDLEYPDGSYVSCVEYFSSGLGMKLGLTVHVERHNGPLVEATLKVIEMVDGKMMLSPRSSNPKHKPLALEGDGGTEIKICGVVTGSYRRSVI